MTRGKQERVSLMAFTKRTGWAAVWLALCLGARAEESADALADARQHISFLASFDQVADADFARGDPRIHTCPAYDQREGKPGVHTPAVGLAAGQGRHGGALRFQRQTREMIYYHGAKNFPYRERDWEGTVSFWLRLDPEEDLPPGYCDPLQVTPHEWNNASMFVDFSRDERPRQFRLGIFADFASWNPQNRPWDAIPPGERPMVVVERHPFAADQWTHVAFTFSSLNHANENGRAELFLNGVSQGVWSDEAAKFSWPKGRSYIMLGLNYVGLYDEIVVFDRALRPAEIQALIKLDDGVRSLLD